ncbi:unnamed protein product [Diamesa serratosioi]
MQGCFISTYYDTLCFAYSNKLCILNCRYDKNHPNGKVFTVTKKVELNANEMISGLLTFPISDTIDWVCIVIGLETGMIQFFNSETALKLYEKRLDTDRIVNIKSFMNEDICVYYLSGIIVIPMFHVVALLKSLRELFIKAKTTQVDLLDKDFILVYKKWEYKNRTHGVNDAVMMSQNKTCLFDHLLSESTNGAFLRYRHTATQSVSVISTGKNPFINFHSAREGYKHTAFSDVANQMAKAVVKNFKNRLPNWLTGTQDTEEVDLNSQFVTELMYPVHEIVDYQRSGGCIWLAPPSYQLAVVADFLGRVILIDIIKGITIRMWKGYRDAQCGFIQVLEEKSRKELKTESRRVGLFLVIFAPKKSVLEIWCLERGPKIATFSASSTGFLFYNLIHHSNDFPSSNKTSKISKISCSCLFFDTNDNLLKNFEIPFHCILPEASSKNAQDFQILKRLKLLLKNIDLKDETTHDAVLDLCGLFQTSEIKIKCLEMLTSSKKTIPAVVKLVIDFFLKNIEIENSNENEIEIKHEVLEVQEEKFKTQFISCCNNYRNLIDCFLMATNEEISELTSDVKSQSIDLLENEYDTLQKLMCLVNINKVKHVVVGKCVSFNESENNLLNFLSSFIVTQSKDIILLNTEKKINIAYDTIGTVLFTNIWKSENASTTKMLEIFKLCSITSEDIIKSFLHFWLALDLNFTNEDHVLDEMTKFKNVLKCVCEYAGGKITFAYNSICLFWQNVREFLLESINPINALLAAIIFKNTALSQQDKPLQDEASFEQVTQEECQWILLNEKLTDVAFLSIFVNSLSNDRPTKMKFEVPKISLHKILHDGRGIVSELTASWIISAEIDIELLLKDVTSEGFSDLNDFEQSVVQKLAILRQHFPFSLSAGAILTNVIWSLVANRWCKNLTDLTPLKKAVSYLALYSPENHDLKHGLCVMLWNATFKMILLTISKLTNKAGCLPKEKTCLQAVGIPASMIAPFLQQLLLFLDAFMSCSKYTQNEYKCEEILRQGKSKSSICEHIIKLKKGNFELLRLNYELISVLELVSFFNLKYERPVQGLFDELCNVVFDEDINKLLNHPLRRADVPRHQHRTDFLKLCISTSIDLIIKCNNTTFVDEHLKWIEKIKKLANLWLVDTTELDREQVYGLYIYGYDDLAESLQTQIQQKELLLPLMIDVAAKRLSLHLLENKSAWTQVSCGGGMLIRYLDILETREDKTLDKVVPSSIVKFRKMCAKIIEIALSGAVQNKRLLSLSGQIYDISMMVLDPAENVEN